MAYNRGSQEVFIDNQSQGTFSSYTAEIRRQVGKTWSFNYGWHQIRVRALGGNYIDLDLFAVDIPSVGTGVYDNTNAQFRWFGTWSDSTYVVGTYNNTNRVSNVGESGFRFTFVGDEITYLYTMTNNRGKAAVTIDGVNKGVIDQYSSDLRRQIGVTYSGLGSGVHILNVVNTGSKNASSIDYYIDVDAVVVGNVYNRTAAVNYADTWAHGRNPNYPNYGDEWPWPIDLILSCNDCTNFVSQALAAGGLPPIQLVPSGNDNEYVWYTYVVLPAGVWAGSKAWAATDWFKAHVDSHSSRYQSRSSVTSLETGDFFVMNLASNDFNGPDHASMIIGSGIIEEGDHIGETALLRNAHCRDRKRVRWDYGLTSDDVVWAYHVSY